MGENETSSVTTTVETEQVRMELYLSSDVHLRKNSPRLSSFVFHNLTGSIGQGRNWQMQNM